MFSFAATSVSEAVTSFEHVVGIRRLHGPPYVDTGVFKEVGFTILMGQQIPLVRVFFSGTCG